MCLYSQRQLHRLVAATGVAYGARGGGALYLHRNPEALARLRAELSTVGLGPGARPQDAEPEAIAKLPYLEAVCQECLRLRPLPVVSRKLARPLTVLDADHENASPVCRARKALLDPFVQIVPVKVHLPGHRGVIAGIEDAAHGEFPGAGVNRALQRNLVADLPAVAVGQSAADNAAGAVAQH